MSCSADVPRVAKSIIAESHRQSATSWAAVFHPDGVVLHIVQFRAPLVLLIYGLGVSRGDEKRDGGNDDGYSFFHAAKIRFLDDNWDNLGQL